MNIHYEVNTKLKVKIVIVLVIVIFCCMIVTGLYISEGYVAKKKISDYSSYSHDSALLFSIDDVKINEINEEGYMEVLGWACEEGNNITRYNCHLALEDALRDTVYILPTMMVFREDVGAYYGKSGYYDSGFYSKARTEKIPFEDNQLEFVIVYENNTSEIYFHTGAYIVNGETTWLNNEGE